jgi:hypothetical protein
MTKITNALIYKVLTNVQSDVSMLKESVRRIDARMGAIENLMAGFHNTLNWHGQALDEHRGRLEHLERPSRDPEK